MKVVANGWFSDAHKISAGVSQLSLSLALPITKKKLRVVKMSYGSWPKGIFGCLSLIQSDIDKQNLPLSTYIVYKLSMECRM